MKTPFPRSALRNLRASMRAVPKYIAAFLALFAITVQPVAAQSILRDAETEALFRDMVSPLVEVSELDAKDVEVVLINDSQINAFVAGGQRMYFYSGTIAAADTACRGTGRHGARVGAYYRRAYHSL